MNINVAIQLALSLIDRAAEISRLIQEAQASGEKTLNAEQWAGILKSDNEARNAFLNALLNAQPIR